MSLDKAIKSGKEHRNYKKWWIRQITKTDDWDISDRTIRAQKEKQRAKNLEGEINN